MRQDILVDENDDLEIGDDGDFVLGESDGQHIRHLMEAASQDYKFDVTLGANVRASLNGSGVRQDVLAAAGKQLKKDGYDGSKVNLDGGQLTIEN